MKSNPGYIRLCQIPATTLKISDLSEESKEKVKSTANYSMSQDDSQDCREVVKRCVIAQLAEQHVANWMEGWCNTGSEDTTDPLSYGFDVLSNIKYCGMRIEVKTHQANSRYISINTGHTEPYRGHSGLHIRPFIELGVADVMIIFDIEELSTSGWYFKPVLLVDSLAIQQSSVVKKSKYEGYYINPRITDETKINFNIFTF